MNKFLLALSFILLFSCGHKSVEKNASDDPLVAVDASVYRGLMEMLGIGDRCIDFSNELKPDPERIVASGASMLMLSAYDGIDAERYRRLGIEVIECTDFNETSPLARAKWMTVYGRMWGVGERADSLYKVVEERYKELVQQEPLPGLRPPLPDREGEQEKNIAIAETPPLEGKGEVCPLPYRGGVGKAQGEASFVFFDTLYGNIWYQPANESTIGQMIVDAGGRLPFSDKQKGGSVPMSKEQMLMQAGDADVWIIRYQSEEPMTLQSLSAMNPVYSQFKAYREGNVWGCNTLKTRYFEEVSFRPDWLLEDFIKILHPEQNPSNGLRYFHKLM